MLALVGCGTAGRQAGTVRCVRARKRGVLLTCLCGHVPMAVPGVCLCVHLCTSAAALVNGVGPRCAQAAGGADGSHPNPVERGVEQQHRPFSTDSKARGWDWVGWARATWWSTTPGRSRGPGPSPVRVTARSSIRLMETPKSAILRAHDESYSRFSGCGIVPPTPLTPFTYAVITSRTGKGDGKGPGGWEGGTCTCGCQSQGTDVLHMLLAPQPTQNLHPPLACVQLLSTPPTPTPALPARIYTAPPC